MAVHHRWMRHRPGSTAVCIVRAERQRGGMLITLLTNRDITEASTKRSDKFTEIDDVVAALRAFLVGFEQEGSP
jgi:hypothetical protein